MPLLLIALALVVNLACSMAPKLSHANSWLRSPSIHELEPRVMVLGTFHFANPGRDLQNPKADNILSLERQKEIEALVDALALYKPTKIAVEVITDTNENRNLFYYRDYIKGLNTERSNEIVQVAFRLAKKLGHSDVIGIDSDGKFPYDEVLSYAKRNGYMDKIEALQKQGGDETKQFEEKQKYMTIGQLLREINEPKNIRKMNNWYMNMLYFGHQDKQPGANLNSKFLERNIGICARLAQSVEPKDRVLVLIGAGHSHALRRCIEEMPGWHLVEANDYLRNF